MSEKSLYPPSPPGESKTYEIGRTALGMESTLGVGEERSEVEKGAWRLLDWKLLPFTAAIFLLAGAVSEHSDPFGFWVELNVLCDTIQAGSGSGKSITTMNEEDVRLISDVLDRNLSILWFDAATTQPDSRTVRLL